MPPAVFRILSWLLLHAVQAHGQSNEWINQLSQNDPDYGLMAPELIKSRGFGYELHHVLSPDGFLIGIHRIINPYYVATKSSFLLLHGILGSSANWLNTDGSGYITEPSGFVGANLGFEIAKRGHDVWLMDQRGAGASRTDVLHPNGSSDYWDWSLDEIALYDLPVVIDYIIEVTGRSQIGGIGYSQGNTVMLMLMSRIPRFNQIIRPLIAIAPIFFVGETIFKTAPELSYLLTPPIENIFKSLRGPVLDQNVVDLLTIVCQPKVIQVTICDMIFFNVNLLGTQYLGLPIPNANFARGPVYLTSIDATITTRQVAQYIQMARTKIPAQLGLSSEENLAAYRQKTPPIYDASQITSESIVLVSAMNDVLADKRDVQHLVDILPNKPVYWFKITNPAFNHLTYIFGESDLVVSSVVRPVLDVIANFYP